MAAESHITERAVYRIMTSALEQQSVVSGGLD